MMIDNNNHPINRKKLPSLIESAYQRAVNGDKRGTERLINYLNTENLRWAYLKLEIANLLHKLQVPTGEEFIRENANSKDPYKYEKYYSLAWLAQHNDVQAQQQLIEALESTNDAIRFHAGMSLIQIGSKVSLPTLFELYDGWIDVGGEIGEDIIYCLEQYLAGDVDVMNALYEKIEMTKKSGSHYFEYIIQDLMKIDIEGLFTTQKLCHLLVDGNTGRRQFITNQLIQHYLDKLNIDTLLEIEEKFPSPELTNIIDTWAKI